MLTKDPNRPQEAPLYGFLIDDSSWGPEFTDLEAAKAWANQLFDSKAEIKVPAWAENDMELEPEPVITVTYPDGGTEDLSPVEEYVVIGDVTKDGPEMGCWAEGARSCGCGPVYQICQRRVGETSWTLIHKKLEDNV